ncbi:Dual specificity protein phosphatase cdc14a [Rhizoclosmatium hyalinum]|nr:Dual specificity protein phosphatase cdc14a [Rhizoclosmatium hyalinum]
MLLVQKKKPEEAFHPLVGINPPFLPYRDAGYGAATYHITILDCLKGLYKALNMGLLHIENLDSAEYEFYEKVEHGDLNWITDKFIAMACPKDDVPNAGNPYVYVSSASSPSTQNNNAVDEQPFSLTSLLSYGASSISNALFSYGGYVPGVKAPGSVKKPYQPAYRMDDLIRLLKERGTTTVVRLNNKTYEKRKFCEAGLEHVELYFPDGTTPPEGILKRFLDLCESTSGMNFCRV